MAVPDLFAQALASRYRGERPVYGVRGVSRRTEGNRGRWPTMTDLAEEVVTEVQRRFPGTPCVVAGYSFGAWLAIEAVRVMEERGIPVHRLYVIAPMPVDFFRVGPFRVRIDGLRQPLDALSAGQESCASTCAETTRLREGPTGGPGSGSPSGRGGVC